ncbi:MAG: TonB-dependent receptor, partial [Armatimonadota bacterium]|nr:TonB-dependent receptor [Armatimonadota bacterium]
SQNALALAFLADKNAGDPRAEASSLTQSFLFDPAIATQLLRGGITTEITPRVGERGERNFHLTNQTTGADGALHAYGLLNRAEDDGARPYDDFSSWNGEEHVTYQAGSRTNVYGNVRLARTEQELAGPASAPVSDDQRGFRYHQGQLAARRRLGAGRTLWLGMFGNSSRSETQDPGLNSFFDPITGLPVRRHDFTSSALLPELRFDYALDPDAPRASLLTLGVAGARTRFNGDLNLFNAIASASGTRRFRQEDETLLAYAQWAQRINQRLSLTSQLRWQRLDQTRTSLIQAPGIASIPTTQSSAPSRLLPSLLATYQADRRTTLRLFANRRVVDVRPGLFTPEETLLTTEPGALPAGTPETMRLLQLDAERYLSSRGFLKLFLFHTTADNVLIGGSDLTGFSSGLPDAGAPSLRLGEWRGRGVGARYEHQLSHHLFANAGLVLRQTSNFNPAFNTVYDNQTAPYEPRRLGHVELNYVGSGGNKIGVRLRHAGSFFADSPLLLGRPRFPARTYVDLRLAKEPSVHAEFFINVTNLFDRSQIAFHDFPIGQRRIEFGMTRRF